jgi:hypothetical protein
MHPDESDFNDSRLGEWKNYLRSVSPNSYTKKIGPIYESKFPELPKEHYANRLPCYRTYEKHGRFYSDWTSLKRTTRNHIFNGDYSIDIKSCHLRIFLSLCRKHIDKRKINKLTGEISERFNPVDSVLKGKTLEEYFAEYSIEKWLWKPLVNACIHGLSENKIKHTLEEYKVTEYPELFRSIIKSRYILESKTIHDAFGGKLNFFRKSRLNNHKWNLIYNSYEFLLKYNMFYGCKLGRVLLDLHDGVVFQLRDRRDESRFYAHIDKQVNEFNVSFEFNLGVETKPVNCLEVVDSRDNDVIEFMKRINLEEIPDSNPLIVDEIIRKALENCNLSHLYRPDWVPFLEEEDTSMG